MFSPAYKRYALALLTTVFTVNLLDRGLIFMFLQPIKEDLQLSDTQLGLVTGIAFALFYVTMGVPIARWADRGNRVTITSLAIGLWGLTAMTSMFVTNFGQLLLARVIAGVGDAGCRPPIYSLIGDYFREPTERVRAMYVFEMASPLAGLVSFMAAGWLNEVYGWRLALFLAGIPGLLLAVVIKWTLVEPPRYDSQARSQTPFALPLKEVLVLMWRQPSCRHMTIAMTLIFMMGQGVVKWQSAFMIRNHGMGTAELGVWMGMIHCLGPAAGLLFGAYLLNRWFADNERGQMRLAAFAIASSVPCYVAFLTLTDKHQALIALIPQAVIFSAFIPATFVLLQRLVPNEMRATVLMVMMFFANLIGMGTGPLMVGILSDALRPTAGTDALRYAMLFMSFLGLWAGYHLLRVGRSIDRDLLDTAQRTAMPLSARTAVPE